MIPASNFRCIQPFEALDTDGLAVFPYAALNAAAHLKILRLRARRQTAYFTAAMPRTLRLARSTWYFRRDMVASIPAHQ